MDHRVGWNWLWRSILIFDAPLLILTIFRSHRLCKTWTNYHQDTAKMMGLWGCLQLRAAVCSLKMKMGSYNMIYWLGRYYFLLGFIYVKNPKRFVVLYSNQKFSTQPLTVFWRVKLRRKEYLPSQWIIFSSVL